MTSRRIRRKRAGRVGDLHLCVDVSPPSRGAEPGAPPRPSTEAGTPVDSTSRGSSRFKLQMAAQPKRLWPPGSTLRVAFLGGDSEVHQRVAAVAGEWTQHANIGFEFGHAAADIRIAFAHGPSWSAVGTEARDVRFKNRPTMNLGWLTPDAPEVEYRRVVLHEFGHALGCVHEHNSPAAGISWRREAAYAYFGGPPNFWSRPQVDANVFMRYSALNTNHTSFDRESIMVYAIPPQLTEDGFSIDWNSELSLTDIAFIARCYPR